MKKTLALVLSLLIAFSMFAVAASAEDATGDELAGTVEIVFKDKDGGVIDTVYAAPGTILTQYVPAIDKEFEVNNENEKGKYTFKGWKSESGNLYYDSTLPTPTEEQVGKTVVYQADYSFKDTSENQSFWQLIESIFARINMLFEYFAKIFNW